MDADGFLHRIGGSARAGIGTALVWDPRAELPPSPYRHTLHGAPRTFPLPITWGGGQGVRASEIASPVQNQRPAPHRGAQVEMQFTPMTRSPPDPTPSSLTRTHLRPSA